MNPGGGLSPRQRKVERPEKHLVHWFRKGLRLHDNPSLREGLRGCSTYRCIFILDPWFAGSSNVDINKWRFLLESLEDLDRGLRKLNSRLFVIRGQPAGVLPKLFKVIYIYIFYYFNWCLKINFNIFIGMGYDVFVIWRGSRTFWPRSGSEYNYNVQRVGCRRCCQTITHSLPPSNVTN